MRRATVTLEVVLLIIGGRSSAQTVVPQEIAALPVWPESNLPPALDKHFVFRDLRTGQIVVTYLDPSDRNHKQVMFRFWLQNRVDPQCTAAIRRDSEGLYVFSYALANGTRAATPIWSWNLVAPSDDPMAKISHPVWRGTNNSVTPLAHQTLLNDRGLAAYYSWMGSAAPIAPGARQDHFDVISSFRPGLTTAYAIGDGGIRAPGEIPEDAVQQLIPLERPQVMYRPFLTIGPRFSPDLPLSQVAKLLRDDLRSALKRGLLDSNSPFLRALEIALAQSAETGAVPAIPPELAPDSIIERDLAHAIFLIFSEPH